VKTLHLSWSARVGLTLLVTGATAAVAGPAEAASWSYATAGTTKVNFQADYGAKNAVVITRSGRTVTIDDRVRLKPGKGCKQVKGDKTRVRCTTKKTPTTVSVKVYDRNDSVINKSDLRLVAVGGPGHDKLVGGPKADVLQGDDNWCDTRSKHGKDKIYGGAGNDTIYADDGADYVSAGNGNDTVYGDSECVSHRNYPGNDVLHGGNGNDTLLGAARDDKLYGGNGNDFIAGSNGRDRLEGGAGNDQLYGDVDHRSAVADVILGGSGRDWADYGSYKKAVTVDLDGASGDDGVPGERDTVGADIEILSGGYGNDRLVGNAAANEINGWGGHDVIYGRGGNDKLDGWDGNNKLYGEEGDDTLTAYSGASHLDGGPSNDTCWSNPAFTLVGCEELRPW
jgi:serralysin